MDWFRSYHGAPTDPKWLTIARRANVRPGEVATIVWALFDHASQNEGDRGSIVGFDAESAADFYGYALADVDAIIVALSDKGIIKEGRFSAWDKRQPKKEDPTAADRKRAQRERDKQGKRDEDASSPKVTDDHDTSRHVTLGHGREEESRLEDKIPPPPSAGTSPSAKGDDGAAVVANRFLELREELWPNDSRLPAPTTTIRTEAQQQLTAGGTVELLTEVIERGMRGWKNPTPPRSLRAFADSLTDRVAAFKRAAEAPASRPTTQRDHTPNAVVIDLQSKDRTRLNAYKLDGKWRYGGDPDPTSPFCQIDRALMREVLGDEFVDRWHGGRSGGAPRQAGVATASHGGAEA